MKKISFCTQCGYSVKGIYPIDGFDELNQITCPSCVSILNYQTGEIIWKPVIVVDIDLGNYPDDFREYEREFYDL